MSAEENKALVRGWVKQCWNQRKVDSVGDFYADEVLFNGKSTTIEELREGLRGYLETVPDLHHTLEDIIAEGEKVTYRWTMRGNNQATGKPEAGRGITFMRIVDGKIVEDWYNWSDIDEDR